MNISISGGVFTPGFTPPPPSGNNELQFLYHEQKIGYQLGFVSLLFFLLFLMCGTAHAQFGGGVSSTGAITPGDCASWSSSNVIQDSGGACGGGGGGGITIGTTTITGGTSPYILYNNAGVVGNEQTVPVANGGTAQTGQTTNGDSSYTIPATSNSVATSATLTAARTWTLPAANTLAAGQTICVLDAAGGVSSSFNLTISRAGSDTFNTINSPTTYVLNSAYQGVCLASNGSNAWDVANNIGLAAPLSLASGLPVTANTFNCTPQNLQWIRKAITDAKTNSSQSFFLMVGDSVTYGEYSNNGSDSGDLVSNSYPTQLVNIFNANGINANSNSFAGGASLSGRCTTDPRLTVGAGWSCGSGNSVGGSFIEETNQDTAAKLTFTPTTAANTFKVFYLTDASAGAFSVDIDGNGAITTNANGASGSGFVTITTALPGPHVLNIKYVSGASKVIYIQGIMAWNSQQSSINVVNAGWGGSTTTNWLVASPAYQPFTSFITFGQAATFINLGLNECNAAEAVATYKANLQSLVTQALTANSGNTNVVLEAMTPDSNGSCTQALQQSYANAAYQVAANSNVCLIDPLARWLSYTNANNLGFMGNTIHPNQRGYADRAQAFFKAIGSP